MTNLSQILSRRVTIINELGLHARSAAMIAKIAQQASAKVWIERDGERVDATSIIDVLSLACPKNTDIIVTIDDALDQEILENIIGLVKKGFGE